MLSNQKNDLQSFFFRVNITYHEAKIFACFFRFMQANVSPTFASIRAFPITVYNGIRGFPLPFRRAVLRFLSAGHTLPSFLSYAGYPHTFPCMAPRYASSLPSRDPWFPCTGSGTHRLHRLLHSSCIPGSRNGSLSGMSVPEHSGIHSRQCIHHTHTRF